MMEKDSRLKHCPFCGSTPEYEMYEDSGGKIINIRCPECLVQQKSFGNRVTYDQLLEYAIKRWNRRSRPVKN